jgi:parallel beta-helix repeat protein
VASVPPSRLLVPRLIVGPIACLVAALALAGATGATLTSSTRPPGCSSLVHPGSGLQRTVNRAGPGTTICLTGGDYDVRRLFIGNKGRPNERITFESADPHHPATLHGAIYYKHSASYWTFAYLHFDGRNDWDLPSPIVDGDHSVWDHVDVTNDHAGAGVSGGGICFDLGQTQTYGYAGDTTIENSRIHDCGISDNHNHGIYVEATTGTTVIKDNWIYRNGDRGVQLYPAAQNVLIENNVIDDNGSGVIFSGMGSFTSRNITVVGNIISNSQKRWNVESWYPTGTPVGTDNIVKNNCLWASNATREYDARGGVAEQVGFTAATNVIQRPIFQLVDGGKLVRAAGSGCKGYGPPGANG